MSAITLENVRVVKNGKLVLAIDFLHIADGELLVVLGPSGAGKTTLLRVIAGLDELTSGHVSFDGDDVADIRTAERGVAMIFQESTLLAFRDVRGNVSFPLEIQRVPRDEIDSRVEAEARVLEIEHLLARRPGQLGAGHQQLVQAARALVRVPNVFLMDEPLARLDAHLRVQMRQEFRLLQEGYGVTTVFITNDQDEAMAMADRIAILEDGRLQQVGAPLDVYRRPSSKFVAQFVGANPMAVLPARVRADAGGYWLDFGRFRIRAWIPSLNEVPEGRVELGIRPEEIVMAGSGTEVTVGRGYFVGSHGYAKVELAPGHWAEMRTAGPPPAEGSTVTVRLRRLHVFHPNSGRTLGRVEDVEAG
jgi:ABC-type sugar transport system ATPase subunit